MASGVAILPCLRIVLAASNTGIYCGAEREASNWIDRRCGAVYGDRSPATTITTSDGSTLTHHDLVVEPKSKGLRDVVAILENAPAQPPVKDAHPVVMDQVDWVFKPRVVVAQHGRPIRFDNSDAVNHSVMAISRVKENQLNSIAAPGMPLSHTFKPQTRPILIGCSLHPWMRAWVYVVEHPWFGVSDAEGKFRIEGIPPGKYRLLLVHSDSKLREQRSVEVQAGQTVSVRVEWDKSK
jgi:plastocyanin